MSTSTDNRRIHFVLDEDRFAIAWLLAFSQQAPITKDQLSCALYLMGLVTSGEAPERKLSFRTMEKRTGWSRQLCMKVSQMLLQAELLQQVGQSSGGSSSFAVGPAFDGDAYRLEVSRWQQDWKSGGLTWPINSLARDAGRRSAKKRRSQEVVNPETTTPHPEEAPEVVNPETTRGVVNPETTRVVNPETTTLRISESSSLEISLEGQPSAEVEQQASALAGSSPAEVPEQPEQPEQPGSGQGSGDGSGLDLAGSGPDSSNQQSTAIESIKAAGIQRQMEYRAKQKQSPAIDQNQPEPTITTNESDYVESQPKAEPLAAWAGLPVESLADGDVLINSSGEYGVIQTEEQGDYYMLWIHLDDGSTVGPITDVDGLRGWSMVATAPTAATLEQQHPDSTAMVITPGTVFTVDDSLSQFITVAADWSDDPSLDTVLAHPVDDPSSLQRFKANVVSIIK